VRPLYKREHYERNKQRYVDAALARNRKLRLERTEWLLEYFDSHPCVDCGETDPLVLEFDHLHDKEFQVGSMLSYRRWTAVLAEIDKCEVRCANCHRRITAYRRGTLKTAILSLRR
jgi:hypothetical protein